MKVFIAGATGVLGIRLVPPLIEGGHTVQGMTRSETGAATLRGLGSSAVICDVYDLPALIERVCAFGPEMVIHQLTDLPDTVEALASYGQANSRMRRDGTDNLLAAAREAGSERFLAQSIAWDPPRAEAPVP